ncbi:hypothetical protein TNCV_4938791 [Trichonephila clavipes]|nr:hypothetical protein TNCV_4938791 [Trichonephila clavipes]
MVLKANDRLTSCPCHDEFRGPRSDYVRQVALATTTPLLTTIPTVVGFRSELVVGTVSMGKLPDSEAVGARRLGHSISEIT